MILVTVVCPDCRRAFVVNGRGRCKCGAYLVHRDCTSSFIRPIGERRYLVGLGLPPERLEEPSR